MVSNNLGAIVKYVNKFVDFVYVNSSWQKSLKRQICLFGERIEIENGGSNFGLIVMG